MLKKYFVCMVAVGFLSSTANSALPIYPAEIIARDLDVLGAGWAGHVGITTAPFIFEKAYQVIEVLNSKDPIIQINLISDFKTKSPYWGSRYGIAEKSLHAIKILREANFQKDLGCATYTFFADYMPSKGNYEGGKPKPTYCGRFRCDTFVNYVFHAGDFTLPTYNPPGSIEKPTIPLYVFNSFPKGNQDGPYSFSPAHSESPVFLNLNLDLDIDFINFEQLNSLSPEEFFNVIDKPKDKFSNVAIENIENLINNKNVDPQKRAFLLDKFGFIAKENSISNLIDLYSTLKSNDEISIKKQLLSTLQNIYQRYDMLDKFPEDKKLLKYFYLHVLDEEMQPVEKAIAIRSYITLSSINESIATFSQINEKINEQQNHLSSQTALKLKMELFNKSPILEKKLLSSILSQLESEDSVELDTIFNEFIVYRLSNSSPTNLTKRSKNAISLYLNSTESKLGENCQLVGCTIFSSGAWLEASALVNSNSFEEAAKYIATYLQNKNSDEKQKFVVGFTNSKYMKASFQSEPVLIAFKSQNKALYTNTVGIN